MKVAVLSGGRSSEHEISLNSGEAVAAGLSQAGHEVISILIGKDGQWICDGDRVSILPGAGLSGEGAAAGKVAGTEVVFPALHGPFGEDGVTQGALDTSGLPYVGSGVLGSAVCMDKLTLKRLCADNGISQVDFVQAVEGDDSWKEKTTEMAWPLWVKPARLGSSVGITRVDGPADLEAAVTEAAAHDPRVIIEANSDGREVECSVLGNLQPEVSLPGEILADAEWYDFEAKYTDGLMKLEVPASIDAGTTDQVRRLAAEVFVLADCAGLARCDFFVEADGKVLLNEVNTMPGFTETSVYGKLWEASGLPYGELCSRLVALAVERHQRESRHSF
ncbi:MAG: D-alanine--D-alanine ligase family protein [Solirubrobacterales bacterium]